MMAQLLDACRRAFGAPPRSVPLGARWRMSPLPPLWMWLHLGDAIWVLYRERARLLRSGRVVWGTLVQANELLFQPATADLPAAALYSPDRHYDDKPEELGRIAQALFALKGTTPADPSLQKLAHDITDELERSYNLRVPDLLTGGREVYLTTIMVHRRHLPGGYLTQGLFPLIAHPASTRATMILPARYWGPELRYFWERRAG